MLALDSTGLDTALEPRIPSKMTGSNIFSFATSRRKFKLVRDHISDPLSSAEIKYVEARAAEDASRSPYSSQSQQGGQSLRNRPSLASITTYDVESQCSRTTSTSPRCLRKKSGRPERPPELWPVPSMHQDHLKKEQSTSTLRSYYDRKQSPLAVSQQTSASSARDFALRKGCPPVIPTSQPDVIYLQNPDFNSSLNRGTSRTRPSRLDFSTLLPKPLPRPEPMLSPQRYTDFPPPVSAVSGVSTGQTLPKTFLHDQEVSIFHGPKTAPRTQDPQKPLRAVKSSPAKTTVQMPRRGVQNWFDGLEGEISEDDADYQPETQPDFVEAAFQLSSNQIQLETAPRPTHELQERVWQKVGTDHPSSAGRKSSILASGEAPADNQRREALHKREVKRSRATDGKRIPVCRPQGIATRPLELADLQKESVLCLSSSDDEQDDVYESKGHEVPGRRVPFLRDSIGVESIGSDIEIGTAQAVNTSFLQTFKPLASSSSVRHNASMRVKPRVQTLKAVKVPDRHSSRQGAPANQQTINRSSFYDGSLTPSSDYRGDHESLSTIRSTKTASAAAQAAAQRNSPLMMALTPQEASLLEAMRSKRATMGQGTLARTHGVAADEDPSLKSSTVRQPSSSHIVEGSPVDSRRVRLFTDPLEVKKTYLMDPASIEPSLPSERASFVFSSSVSSPTTSRDSPATPKSGLKQDLPSPATPSLDSQQDITMLHGLRDFPDPGLYTVNVNQFGHARSRTSSSQIIVLDSFPQSPKDSIITADGFPWIYGQFTERANAALIH